MQLTLSQGFSLCRLGHSEHRLGHSEQHQFAGDGDVTSDLKASVRLWLVSFVLSFSVSQILQEFFKRHTKERPLEMRPSRRGMFSFVPCLYVMAWTACGWESRTLEGTVWAGSVHMLDQGGKKLYCSKPIE